MKKNLLIVSALAGLFFANSCQREILEPASEGTTVSYTLQIPEVIATKTNAADFTVYYEVYRNGELNDMTKSPIYDGNKQFQGNSATLDLEFVKNQSFTVLFWAQVAGSDVYVIDDLRNVTLNNSLTSYASDVEVFAGLDTVSDCVSAVEGNVRLERPIAQINIATLASGLNLGNATTVLPGSTQVTVNGLCNAYNVATKAATGEVNVVYKEAAAPNTDFNADYKLIAQNYIGFIPAVGSTVDVSFTMNAGVDGNINHTVVNVPVKPNYRTTIIGNLVSATTDYSITLDTEWQILDYGQPVVDGGVEINGAYIKDNTYSIVSASGFKWLATKPAGYFAGKTIKLQSNIDLNSEYISPINFGFSDNPVTFDGQNFTIKKFIIYNFNSAAQNFHNDQALFNGKVDIKNLKVAQANVYGGGNTGVVGGTIFGTLDNCHVENSVVNDYFWQAGGLVGRFCGGSITGCSVSDVKVTTCSSAGALVGQMGDTSGASGPRIFKQCTANRCEINMYVSLGPDYDADFGLAVGFIYLPGCQIIFEECDFNENKIKGISVDTPIYGTADESATITIL